MPGLVLAIARPWRVTLVESVSRKADFLASAVEALGLNAQVRWERAEACGRSELRESCDAAVARAVGRVATCLELTLPLVRVGGAVVLYRGPSEAEAETASAAAVSPQLGGGAPEWHQRTLPSGAARRLLWVSKPEATPERFPRRDGVPAKRPLE